MSFPDTTFTTGTTITSNWLNAVNDVCDANQTLINAQSYGATGDGVTDDTIALQAAISAGIAANADVFIPAGTYKTTSTLLITNTTIKIFGAGRYATNISYTGSSSAILCSGWGGTLDSLAVYTVSQSANGIEAGNDSRNCTISNVYVQVTGSYSALNTGAGILLAGNGGWSGGLEIRTTYVLAFKYGIKMTGTNLATDTWTTVSMYNCWFAGSTLPSGSAGIYMDQYTNGVGTCLYGGTIEGYDTGIVVENGSWGGIFECDSEGNAVSYSVGPTFQGRIVHPGGVEYRASENTYVGPTYAYWDRYKLTAGQSPKQEWYYSPEYQVTQGGGQLQTINYYHCAGNLIDGTMTGTYKLKYSIGLGQGGDYGNETHPSSHYIQLAQSKLHWGNESPSARTGNQVVAWTQGDICFNLSATVGQPKGWVCTVSGTPGTWVSMGNL